MMDSSHDGAAVNTVLAPEQQPQPAAAVVVVAVAAAVAVPSEGAGVLSRLSRTRSPDAQAISFFLNPLPPPLAFQLGYQDLGIRNGGITITPTIDELISTGITLSSYCEQGRRRPRCL